MNIMQRLICVIVVNLCFVPVVRPKTITVKLFKTDQETWKKPFSYALVATKHTKKTQWFTGNVIQDEPKVTPSFKSMNKNGSVSFDADDLSDELIVCPKPNGEKPCYSLDLEDHRKKQDSNWVVGINHLGEPKSMSQSVANKLINDSKPPALYPVAVKKIGDNRDLWTIKAIKSNALGEPDIRVVYNVIAIRKNTTGPFVRKLKVPFNKELFIRVEDKKG